MERPEALSVYAALLRKEREDWLYRHALNKVHVITRIMSPAEKVEYLQGRAFQATLYQIQRRDKVLQGLIRGELVLSPHRAEFDQLAPLIMEDAGNREGFGDLPYLAFLRSVARSRVPLKSARNALALLKDKEPRRFFGRTRTARLEKLEGKIEYTLRRGDLARLIRPEQKTEDIFAFTMRALFRRGVPMNVISLAMHPLSVHQTVQRELTAEYPDLAACARICLPSGETVSTQVRREAEAESGDLIRRLRRRFPEERIRSLIRENPSLGRIQRQRDAALAKERNIRAALLDAIPAHYRDLYPLARQMRRHFYLHLGPTNSGKTYEGVERLHGALHGIYLGPLRLLAAEQFEALNLDDVPCSLVTGEEQILVPGSRVQSSTVEMADLKARYDVAVIDECQMIADRDRGGAWSAAILGLCADEIHACASPDAEALLTRIITECGDELTIVRHERMTKLEIEKEGFQFPTSVRPGDALIVFSKARVHAVAAELRSRGVTVSLIYGALPPDVRRNQAERFHRKETDVVVSTDAIAMGMNLPIERVVFLESEKYDGDITRTLTDAEIKQIAGRAGRFGMYDTGYVNAFGFKSLIAQAMERPLLPLAEAVIRFPESLLGIPLPLSQIIEQWLSMQDKGCFSKASAARMAALTAMMETRNTDKALLYRFLCIPFDEADPDLLSRWKEMYHTECQGGRLDVMPLLPEIRNPEDCTILQLDILEEEYRRCDLYYNYARLFLDNPDRILAEIQRRKDLISQGIVHVLSTQKLQQKTCVSCKRRLPWNWPYKLCDSCWRRAHFARIR